MKADVSLSGAKVQLDSLSALVNGAIAFDSRMILHRLSKTRIITYTKTWRTASAAWWLNWISRMAQA